MSDMTIEADDLNALLDVMKKILGRDLLIRETVELLDLLSKFHGDEEDLA